MKKFLLVSLKLQLLVSISFCQDWTGTTLNVQYADFSFPSIKGLIRHEGNASGFSLYSQGANNSTYGSGGFTFFTTDDNTSSSSTDAAYRKSLEITPSGNLRINGNIVANGIKTENGIVSSYYYVDFPNIRGLFKHEGNASGFSFYSQGANNSTYGSGGFTFFTTNENSSSSSTDALYRRSLEISPIGNVAIYGKLETTEIKVTDIPRTADFVFDNGYNLRTLSDIEKFIVVNKHLPEIPSANEMKENGLNISEFQIKLLQKIEELTLYTIEQNKSIEQLKKFVELQAEKIKKIETASK